MPKGITLVAPFVKQTTLEKMGGRTGKTIEKDNDGCAQIAERKH